MDNGGNTLRTTGLRATMLLLLMAVAHCTYAQWGNTAIYDFDYDMKHYSVTQAVDGVDPHETVMGGTVYGFPVGGGGNKTVAHYLNIGAAGGVNNSYIFDASDYDELRSVSVISDGQTPTTTYYMICQVRKAGSSDGILVISFNLNGTVNSATEITPPSTSEGLYPLHSIYHSNDHIYICGYYTYTNSTNLPNEPSYVRYDEKSGFVLKFDPNSNTVTNSATIDTRFTGNTSIPPYDYDIAMRLVEMQNPAYLGEIFVTGSVNNVKHYGNPASEQYHSATMNVVLRASNLTQLDVDNFAFDDDNYTQDEYGIGMVEDVANNKYYIIGNYFSRRSGQGSAATYFDPIPTFVWATGLDNNMDHATGFNNDSRYSFNAFDYAWGLQTLGTHALNVVPGYTRFLIAGMAINDWCDPGNGSYYENTRPFLWDLELEYNPITEIIAGSPWTWTTYTTQTGTGWPNINPNSYWDLGGGISNVAWNPTFAMRPGTASGDDIVMSAPRWFNASGSNPDRLNLKTIRADYDDYEVLPHPVCSTSFNQTVGAGGGCHGPGALINESVGELGFTTPYIVSVTPFISNITLTVNTDPKTISGTLYNANGYDHCGASGVAHYKPGATNVSSVQATGETVVYPNPAGRELKVKLASGIKDDDQVTVELKNILGQTIAELYRGKAGDLSAQTMNIPSVSSGLYQVLIYSNDKIHYREKLSIHQ